MKKHLGDDTFGKGKEGRRDWKKKKKKRQKESCGNRRTRERKKFEFFFWLLSRDLGTENWKRSFFVYEWEREESFFYIYLFKGDLK